jgi:hypothetical protein
VVRGGDFMTGRYEIAPGEQIIDCDTDLDSLPAWGLLCLHEQSVRDMVKALGWKLHDPKLVNRVFRLREQVGMLREENRVLRQALATIVGEPTDIPETPVIEEETASV